MFFIEGVCVNRVKMALKSADLFGLGGSCIFLELTPVGGQLFVSRCPAVFEVPAPRRSGVLSGFVSVVGGCVVVGTCGSGKSSYGVAWRCCSVYGGFGG